MVWCSIPVFNWRSGASLPICASVGSKASVLIDPGQSANVTGPAAFQTVMKLPWREHSGEEVAKVVIVLVFFHCSLQERWDFSGTYRWKKN